MDSLPCLRKRAVFFYALLLTCPWGSSPLTLMQCIKNNSNRKKREQHYALMLHWVAAQMNYNA